MLPLWHVVFGLIICISIYLIFPITLFEVFVIFISSTILVDLDHYFRYIIIKKSVNPFKFWNWYMQERRAYKKLSLEQKRKCKKPLFIFHNIEFWILVFILCFLHNIFMFVLIGTAIHMFIDLL